jgi:arsenate reductase
MAEKGIDISAQTSKYLSQILDLKDYAIIVSLCEEAERGLPSLPSRPVRINWKVQDPSRIEGTEEEIHAAYQKTFQFLDTHLRELVQAILGDDVEKEKETNV